MSHLELCGVAKTYADGTPAVRGVDLAVERGEFVVLLGPSGCGKTTTLRMIAGLEIASAGRVLIDGVDATRHRPSRRDIGFVFQFYALYPGMSVRENIAFPLRNVGVPRAEVAERVAAIAERLDIIALLDRRPGQLAGGDQQRVALARSLVRTPALSLMDEPLGTLDADQRQAMAEYIREHQLASGITTLYVTHDQEEAMRLADRIVVMRDGRIQQVGSPGAVYADPANLFVADFLGSPGMNHLRGTIAAGGDALCAAEERLPLPWPAPPGRDVVLGIRAEGLRPDPQGPVRGRVVHDEYQGGCRIVHLDTAFGPVAVRLAADAAQTGELRLRGEPGAWRLFDAASGAALARESTP